MTRDCFSSADFRRGLHILATGNPEEWCDFHDIEHPVGNLNAVLLEAVSAQSPHLHRQSLDVAWFGTFHLQTLDVELQELFRSFSSICSRLASGAAKEWADFAVTGEFGANIRAIGRAEKRLVVCAARLLLQHSAPDSTSHLEAAARAVERNAAATDALRQLLRLPRFRTNEHRAGELMEGSWRWRASHLTLACAAVPMVAYLGGLLLMRARSCRSVGS